MLRQAKKQKNYNFQGQVSQSVVSRVLLERLHAASESAYMCTEHHCRFGARSTSLRRVQHEKKQRKMSFFCEKNGHRSTAVVGVSH